MVDLLIGIVIVAFASMVIARACDGFEAAADYLGRNMTEGMKGATINAVGSSMPELCVTFIYLFLYHNTTGFAGGIGTTAGSAVFNAMIIPAFVILAVLIRMPQTTISVSRAVVLRDGITLISAEAFLIFFLGDRLEWYHGLFLMLLYISYAVWMIYRNSGSQGDDAEEEEDEDLEQEAGGSRIRSLFILDLTYAVLGGNRIAKKSALSLLALSTVIIAIACWMLVYSCEKIGFALGIHGYFVAVILAAAASSVPDTILSVKDARKGNYDDALSNALGSNIFDICFALGAPLFLFTILNGPILIETETLNNIIELRLLLLMLTIAVFLVFLCSKRMGKGTAWIMIGLYAVFVFFVAGRAYDLALANGVAKYLHIIQACIN